MVSRHWQIYGEDWRGTEVFTRLHAASPDRRDVFLISGDARRQKVTFASDSKMNMAIFDRSGDGVAHGGCIELAGGGLDVLVQRCR
jgi:hypothetical protein